MSDRAPPQASIVLEQSEDGRMRGESRFEHEMLWLTQGLIADVLQITMRRS
jgi:hypothetical protein